MKSIPLEKIITRLRNKYLISLKSPSTYLVKNNSLTGFTLIELMLVVIIIGVLVAMVMPRLVGRSEEARITAAKADINANLALALDLFELDNGRYPTTQEGLNALKNKPSALTNWKGPYIKKIPIDPWGQPYKYNFPGRHDNDYDLFSLGKDGTEGTSDDIGNW